MTSRDSREEHSPLLKSAYDFVEHSIEEFEHALSSEPRRWKFAIIDIATAVELFLKERLRREHPLLIYSRIEDARGHTVSLDIALKRLRVCSVHIDNEDAARLAQAREMRNSIVHFSTSATADQLREAYVDWFEFASHFHAKELGAELHNQLDKDYHIGEASIMEFFRREFVPYHGQLVHRGWPGELVESQFDTHWIIDGVPYARIPHGDLREYPGFPPSTRPCHDCAALPGQLHGSDCDMDVCPKCGGQTLSFCCGNLRELGSWPIEVAATDGTLEGVDRIKLVAEYVVIEDDADDIPAPDDESTR